MIQTEVHHPRRRAGWLIATAAVVAVGLMLPSSGTQAEDMKTTLDAEAQAFICPAPSLQAALGKRLNLAEQYKLPANETFNYQIGNAAVARITGQGMLVPLAQGSTMLTLKTETPGPVACQVKLQVGAAVAGNAPSVKAESKQITVGSKRFSVQVLYIPKGMTADVGLGQDRIGGTDSLASIAKRRHADAAVNGTFFESYGGIPEPWGTVIADGEVAHIGNTGTAIGFQADGSAMMDTLRISTAGTVQDGAGSNRSIGWYTYFVNRTPAEGANSAILFTPKRGSRIGFARGTAIVVRAGIVDKIARNENVIIPKDGYVIVYTGTEEGQAKRFTLGSKVSYKMTYRNAEGKEIAWDSVITAVGAGPRLVKDGQLSIHAKEEGFTQDKILTSSAARSGIGIRKDGSLIIVTTTATIAQLGGILLKLGAVQGMNLDGGASSGLYENGRLRTTPGRTLSNALVFGNHLTFQP